MGQALWVKILVGHLIFNVCIGQGPLVLEFIVSLSGLKWLIGSGPANPTRAAYEQKVQESNAC